VQGARKVKTNTNDKISINREVGSGWALLDFGTEQILAFQRLKIGLLQGEVG